MLVIVHFCDVATFGQFSLTVSVVLAVIQICDCRIWETLTKFLPVFSKDDSPNSQSGLIQLCVLADSIAGLIAFAVLLSLSPLISALFANGGLEAQWIRLMAPLALLTLFQEPLLAFFRVTERFHYQTAFRTVLAPVRLLVSFIAVMIDPSVEALLIAELITRSLGFVGLSTCGWVLMRREKIHPIGVRMIRDLGDQLPVVGKYMLLGNFVGNMRFISARADTLVLGVFTSPEIVAVYEIAKRVVEQVSGLAGALYMAVFPEISRLVAQGQHEEVRRLRWNISRSILVTIVPACVLGTLIAPYVIPAVFGPEYVDSVPLFQVLIWQLLWLVFVWFSGWVLAYGYARAAFLCSLVETLLLIAMLLAFVPIYGAMGAAFAMVVRSLVWMILAGTVTRMGDSKQRSVALAPVSSGHR